MKLNNKLGDQQYGLLGYSCVSRPRCTQDHPDAPLMYAIGYALDSSAGLDFYLRAIFPPYPENSPGGGDPGWLWYYDKTAGVSGLVTVEIDDVVAPPSGMWNEYSNEKIRYEIRAALNNLVVRSPERLKEVGVVIDQFDLFKVMAFEGLVPIADWDGGLPCGEIINS
ncbi:hypothetical protein [Andreprevotia sp. IGB-42]|uniref:hypothetical protein n=1 Tax=Andreprevotia sp. IGB-42 TaxID=2497473 RepID=UPI00135846F3|nr:hypothetical protein [Andreprevotia sp. IGB-42]